MYKSNSTHFLSVNIESVGALPPDVLFLEAVEVLRKKCSSYLKEISTKLQRDRF